jgi:hypothetical protein
MKTYHGERTERGCEVTVDGHPLQRHADLSGNASSPFDWGFIGTGQLSMAILSDFLGDDPKAKAICGAFEEKVIAELPHRSWTLTGRDLANAVAPLVAADDSVAVDRDDTAAAAFGDMPVESVGLATTPDTFANSVGSASAPLGTGNSKSSEERVTAPKADQVTAAAGENVAAAAMAVGKAAHQVAHVCDRPTDEPMSTANRAADQKAAATNRVVDEAAALADSASSDANRVAAELLAKLA